MKAFVIDGYGGSEKVHAADIPEPTLARSDVLIEVRAAGVNPLDLKIREGALKALLKLSFPLVLGNDVAGVVKRAGASASRFKAGDEVYARTDTKRMGGFAERVAVDATSLSLKPRTLSMTQAAAVPLVALTAWQALVERAGVEPGQKVLVLAGSGGVGTMAIQLAKHLGAEVATTAGSGSAELVRRLGADRVIDYKREDFSKLLKGYDVVLDTQGGEDLEKSFHVLKRGGKVVSLAGPPDPSVAETLGAGAVLKLLLGALSWNTRRKARKFGVTYSFLFMRPDGAQLAKLGDLFDNGVLEAVVDRTFPFDQTSQALAYVEAGHAKGKVVVEIS